MTISLDRMALEEVGSNPLRVANAILDQANLQAGPVPIEQIALALDITEIRREPLTNFEGALVTTAERGFGQILVNERSHHRRQRYTVGHELFHFLSPWHLPTSPNGFLCKREDLRMRLSPKLDRNQRQEAEANTFAIELLTPRARLKRSLRDGPDLSRVVDISDEFEISRESAARRYVELHDEALAVVFSRDGRVSYIERSAPFPRLALWNGSAVPELPLPAARSKLSEVEEADPSLWLESASCSLTVQTLHQVEGWATTLLHAEVDEDRDEDGLEDSYSRFSKLGDAS